MIQHMQMIQGIDKCIRMCFIVYWTTPTVGWLKTSSARWMIIAWLALKVVTTPYKPNSIEWFMGFMISMVTHSIHGVKVWHWGTRPIVNWAHISVISLSTFKHMCQECVTGGKCTSRARDMASVTQVERCALHLMHVLYLSDGGLAILRRRRGGNLVDIRTNCIWLYLTGL